MPGRLKSVVARRRSQTGFAPVGAIRMSGEKVVILGPSGSGKSTLLRCINALEEADSGSILVDGIEVTSRRTNLNHLREHLGMVFQRFNLWPHLTVIEKCSAIRWIPYRGG